jgi:Protein of unknown function (DUF2384)
VASSLLAVTGSEKGLKMWLHSMNKRFDNHTPLEVIKHSKAAMLADWVDDARLGSPQTCQASQVSCSFQRLRMGSLHDICTDAL